MNELKARVQWYLLFNNLITSAKDVVWNTKCTSTRVLGTFTYKDALYDVIGELMNGDLVPTIQKHDQPHTRRSYAWG